MSVRSSVDLLREKLWLKALPDSIDVPTSNDTGPTISKPIAEASVDDIALAISALGRQSSALYRKADALRQVHDLARQVGGLGTANAVDAAAKTLEGAR